MKRQYVLNRSCAKCFKQVWGRLNEYWSIFVLSSLAALCKGTGKLRMTQKMKNSFFIFFECLMSPLSNNIWFIEVQKLYSFFKIVFPKISFSTLHVPFSENWSNGLGFSFIQCIQKTVFYEQTRELLTWLHFWNLKKNEALKKVF